MNNNLYQWHDGFMAEMERQEFRRHMDQARMLREAGLDGGLRAARVVKALGRFFTAAGSLLRNERPRPTLAGKPQC